MIIQKRVRGVVLYYPLVKHGEGKWKHVEDWNGYTRRWKHYKREDIRDAVYVLTIQGIDAYELIQV
jgi:hypothetical protein